MLPLLLALASLAQDPAPPPIFGGSPPAAAPDFAVALLDDTGEVVCSGVLLRGDLVLTAAHCTITADRVARSADTNAARVGILDVQRHPGWRSEGLDAAVVLLDEPLLDEVTTPLAYACAADLADGDSAHIWGFGSTRADGTGDAGELLTGEVQVLDADCSDTEGCRPGGGELVALGAGVDACVGDSGGALEREGVVYGLVARAVPGGDACGTGGIYTRTDALEDWIIEMVGEDPSAPCETRSCGCQSAPASGLGLWMLAALGLIRRRRSSGSLSS